MARATAPARALVAAALGASLAGCGTPSTAPEPTAAGHVPVTLPATGTLDYQLGGAYPPPADVSVVVRDAAERPVPGLFNVCYVNGFQSQPGDADRWLTADVVLRDDAGEPVVDPAWPDELILDPSTPRRRATIIDELTAELARCADAGYDAVELDNLDSWTRSGGRLTRDDALALAAGLADVAHGLGLAVAQKNAAELGTAGRDVVGFDLAVVEECVRWDECDAYSDVYGELVLAVEYTDDLPGTVAEVCAWPDRPSFLVVRDRDLAPAGDPAWSFAACPR